MKSKTLDLLGPPVPVPACNKMDVSGFSGPLAADAKPTTEPMQVYADYWPFKSKAERDAVGIASSMPWVKLEDGRD